MKVTSIKIILWFLFLYIFGMNSMSLVNAEENTIPDVHFAVFILDYDTYSIRKCYEFSQPYCKSLPEDDFILNGKVFYQEIHPADTGYLKVISSLTGELILHIETMWGGGHSLLFPDDSLQVNNYEFGFSNADPDTILSLFETTEKADSAWYAVRDTDIVNRLTSTESYEVVYFSKPSGNVDSNTGEWYVIAYTCPDSPKDMAILGDVWPQKVMTKDIPITPQIVLHNFGGNPEKVNVKLTVSNNTSPVYESVKTSGIVPADSSQKIIFDSLTISNSGEYEVVFTFHDSNGLPWEDSYPENDIWQQNILCSAQPVFKMSLQSDPLGLIPLNGYIFDFDDDGDWDVFQYNKEPIIYECVDGKYINITGQVDIELPTYPRLAVAEDLNGDHFQDLLIVYNHISPVFLLGDGTGTFIDYTNKSGLSKVIGKWEVEVFDKENDGDLDLIFTTSDQESIFENNGTGYFTDVTSESGIDDPFQTEEISSGDLNNDGFVDLVFSNWDDLSRIYINNGDGRFSHLETEWSFHFSRMSVIFDYNSDGLNDILFAQQLWENTSILFKNTGALKFEEIENAVLGDAFAVEAADINADNNPEILIDNIGMSSLFINQDNEFINCSNLLVDISGKYTGGLGHPKFVDLDNDGDLDIYSRSAVFENMGFVPIVSNIETDTSRQLPYSVINNYPNPFNSSTIINYTLPAHTHVKLSIYNTSGQRVSILKDEFQQAGSYSAVWNGAGYSAGVYFCTVRSGGRTVTRKMMLVK